ncbi:hypothetical protein M758_11G115900 [Ceratodon purpureus]|nr:hypothetical protein M758_11G115900 [Ceratodon purpureus]
MSMKSEELITHLGVPGHRRTTRSSVDELHYRSQPWRHFGHILGTFWSVHASEKSVESEFLIQVELISRSPELMQVFWHEPISLPFSENRNSLLCCISDVIDMCSLKSVLQI